MQLLSYETRERLKRWLYVVPSWSTLRTLGQSRLLALTALIPFLGTLILFNQQLVDFLLLSPTLVGRWTGSTDQIALEWSRSFTLSRLQMTYFGLVFLGVGSFLFVVLCPADIKRYTTVSDYIAGEKPLITRARTGLLVLDVVTDYLRNHGEEEAWGPKYVRDLAYSTEQVALFDSVFKEITENLDWGDEQPPPTNGTPAAQIEPPDPDPFKIYTAFGYVDTEKVARILYSGRRVERVFWETFYVTAGNYLTDLLTLRYVALDHSKPTFRLIVASSYTLGFVILFLPTISTFILILRRIGGL